jgi:hypothetical protein
LDQEEIDFFIVALVGGNVGLVDDVSEVTAKI